MRCFSIMTLTMPTFILQVGFESASLKISKQITYNSARSL
jgi:hypothetical protein